MFCDSRLYRCVAALVRQCKSAPDRELDWCRQGEGSLADLAADLNQAGSAAFPPRYPDTTPVDLSSPREMAAFRRDPYKTDELSLSLQDGECRRGLCPPRAAARSQRRPAPTPSVTRARGRRFR